MLWGVLWTCLVGFPHEVHVVEEELACTFCHAEAEQSTSPRDNLTPASEEPCLECHEEGETGYARPPAEILIHRFSHRKHMKKEERSCSVCHGDPARPVLPAMDLCMACHREENVRLSCTGCHERKDLRLRAAHPENWDLQHGVSARLEEQRCLMCHGITGGEGNPATPCVECHERDDFRFAIHPPDYAWLHTRDVAFHLARCETCHQGFEDCRSCHRRKADLPLDHMSPSWKEEDHGTGARINPERCVVCHGKGEITCARCHRGTGP